MNEISAAINVKETCIAIKSSVTDNLLKVYKEKQKEFSNQLSPLIKSTVIFQQVYGALHTMTNNENELVLDEALNCIPLEKIYSVTESKMLLDENQEFSHDDLLVKEILHWFKSDFFKWVNKETCSKCGNENQDCIQLLGGTKPTVEERNDGGATNVEIYKCLECHNTYRFPRYNTTSKLLRTRKGRCGEFANCFYAILRSMGFKVRYVWNYEDHVWTEYYSSNFKSWVHLDSCEDSYNNSLLYCNNWGKKMSYVVGMSPYGVVDLSNKYIDQRNPENQLPRDKVDERIWRHFILQLDITEKLRSYKGNKVEFYDLVASSFMERKKLRSKNWSLLYDNDLNRDQAVIGRISGSKDWKSNRGESGN